MFIHILNLIQMIKCYRLFDFDEMQEMQSNIKIESETRFDEGKPLNVCNLITSKLMTPKLI